MEQFSLIQQLGGGVGTVHISANRKILLYSRSEQLMSFSGIDNVALKQGCAISWFSNISIHLNADFIVLIIYFYTNALHRFPFLVSFEIWA